MELLVGEIDVFSATSDDVDSFDVVGALHCCTELEGADGGTGEKRGEDEVCTGCDEDGLVEFCVEGSGDSETSPAGAEDEDTFSVCLVC